MRIQHNIPAMNSYRNYAANTKSVAKNLEKLSSGYRINRAGDDAAGLAISEKMRAQITGLKSAQKNAKDGISLIQTAEGALTEVHSMLNRMSELAGQSANGTYDNEVDRSNLQKEVSALKTEIDRIADSSNFNGIKLLNGSLAGGSISSDGANFKGAEVAAYKAAEQTVTLADWTSGGALPAATGKDTFVVDGNSITIDWSKGDAKNFFDSITATDNGAVTADGCKDLASKMADILNSALTDAGYSNTVKVTGDGTTGFKITSNDSTSKSEITFAGSDTAESLGSKIFGNAITVDTSVVNKATQTYNGDTLVGGNADEQFQMNINGVSVKVDSIAVTKGGTLMDTAAGFLETNVQAAVTAYNSALGLTAGAKDDASGLTGLTEADFTVEVKDGAFQIKYGGDEDVNFSFSDIGSRTVAATLGLANGSSKAGGNQGLTLQIGDTAESFNQLNVSINDMHCRTLGINSVDISNQVGASAAMDKIKTAINSVSSTRGDLGALQNRLDHTINNLSVMTENIQDAEANIRDTDVAQEMMEYTKNNILVQSAQAMLAQANQLPQGVLQLLG